MKWLDLKLFNKTPADEIPKKMLHQWLKKNDIDSDKHLDHLVFDDFILLNSIIRKTKKAKRQRFEKFRDAYFRSDIQKKIFPSQSIVNIGYNLEKGVISNEIIPPNSFLGEYTGIIRRYIPNLDKSNRYLVKYPLKLNIFNSLVIDASKYGNHTRFYNHSNKPNAYLASVICDGIFRMIAISTSRIQNQSQILIDYGKLYWKQIGKTPDDLL